MSVSSTGQVVAAQPGGFLWRRVVLAGGALLLVALGLLAVSWWVAASAPAPVRNPFGTGIREAAPAASGLGALVLAWQSSFYRALTAALSALKQDGGIAALIGLSFAYGVFHAAGPGHGKAVISAYLVATEAALRRGFLLSLGASIVQGVVAFLLVATLTIALAATAQTLSQATRVIEIASFAALATFGLWLLWRKAGDILLTRGSQGHDATCAPGCAHDVMTQAMRSSSWRDQLAVMASAGLRPCTGAIVVLVFALSQGLLVAGVVAVFAMALGTALTTGLLAALAVFGKRAAVRLAGGRPGRWTYVVPAVELLAAAFVAALGVMLTTGLVAAGAGS